MDFDTYQDKAMETAIYHKNITKNVKDPAAVMFLRLSYVSLKLAGEAGEFAEKIGKLLRDTGNYDTFLAEPTRQTLLKELGDVLWYVAVSAKEIGFTLNVVAKANLAKLADRSDRGMIGGSGDDR